jgi:hypothetical protein
MDDAVRARLREADDADHWDRPPGFAIDAEMRRVRAVKPKIEKILGSVLELDENIERAAHFAQLTQKVHEGEVFLTRLAISFSCFSRLVTVWGNAPDATLVRAIVKLLEIDGYRYVPMEALREAYDGRNRQKTSIRTWYARFFDYV